MIYGINFKGADIPAEIKRKFPQYVKVEADVTTKFGPAKAKLKARLVGVGQSEDEKNAMLLMAYNGHRRLHVEERQTATGIWYGVYAY